MSVHELISTISFVFTQGWRKKAVVHDFDDGSCVIAVSCDDKRSCRRVSCLHILL